METPARFTFSPDGNTKVFPIPVTMKGDNYVRIDIDGVILNDRSKFDLVNNAVVFVNLTDVPSGSQLDVLVVQTDEGISNLGNVNSVDLVASNITDVQTVAGSIASVNTTAANIASVNTTATNIAAVNTTATNIASVVDAVNQANAAAASAAAALVSKNAAAASESAADASETAAATSASAAATSASSSASSASAALTSKNAAAVSETNAANSATASASSATSSANSATASATSAAAALVSENAALASKNAAAVSATAAANSESAAAISQTAAASSATNASASEVAAAASAAAALVSESNAAASEGAADASAISAAQNSALAIAAKDAAAISETNAATSATSAAGSASSASTSAAAASASQIAAAASAASAANSYDLFDDRYLGTKASDPTLDNDNNPLVAGALYFNSTANEMRVYDGGNWIAASSAGGASLLKYEFTATSGQTVFTGADDNGATLSYTQENIVLFLNGVALDDVADYTATDGTSIVLTSGATAGDLLYIIAFKSFTTADMVSASTGGTFYNSIAIQGNLSVTGTIDGVDISGLASVATSGDYNDLINTPSPFDPNTLATVATTGSYTDLSNTPSASDLLTSIKTVDGAGSGLDADTLDGNQASAFALASHSHDYVPERSRSDWNDGTVINNVVGQLAWKNYGNNHTIFDASAGISPDGTAVNNTHPSVYWAGSYPTLMGWNGGSTYGVRVDTARYAESTAAPATGVVGSYAYMARYGGLSAGSTYAGSELYYGGVIHWGMAADTRQDTVNTWRSSSTGAGTWRAMGTSLTSTGGQGGGTLCVRIS